MEYTQIEVRRDGEIVVLTLNRPEKLNAWTPTMADEQAHAITAANDDPSVGAIVMTGAGRGFCAGADMEATFRTRITGSDPGRDTAGGVGGMPAGLDWVALVRASKPIVSAVNGPAVGIGLTMCLPSDQIIASTSSKFGTGFIKMGLVPELASTRLLAARIGFGRASDLFLSGRIISGTDAHRLGLADQLTEPDDLLATAVATAPSYAANPDLQLRMTKQLLTENVVETDLVEIQRREQRMLAECWKSPEHAEAVSAFLEKRPAVFPAELMAHDVDVCVIGSANLDLIATADRLPEPGETVLGSSYVEHPGGKGLNQSVAAARAGARTAMIGALGDDDAGTRLHAVIRDDAVDSSRVETLASTPTGRALIGVSATGENSIIVVPGANGAVAYRDLPSAVVVLAQLEIPLGAVVRAFDAEPRESGATTILNPAPAQELSGELLMLCDIVVPNEHEIEMLGGVDRLLSLGAQAVVVTQGSRGATLHTRDGITHVQPFVVDSIDSTGAGDTFCGTLAARISLGETIERAMPYASAAAALSTTRTGAVPSIPTRAEVDTFLRETSAGR